MAFEELDLHFLDGIVIGGEGEDLLDEEKRTSTAD
jgi:hypothetical protein